MTWELAKRTRPHLRPLQHSKHWFVLRLEQQQLEEQLRPGRIAKQSLRKQNSPTGEGAAGRRARGTGRRAFIGSQANKEARVCQVSSRASCVEGNSRPGPDGVPFVTAGQGGMCQTGNRTGRCRSTGLDQITAPSRVDWICTGLEG
jgi:hypothetical protein